MRPGRRATDMLRRVNCRTGHHRAGRTSAPVRIMLLALLIVVPACDDKGPTLGAIDAGALRPDSDIASWERLDEHEPPRRLRDPRTGVVFRRVEPGSFPQHVPQLDITRTIRVSRPFLLAETEFTAGQFRAFASRAIAGPTLPIPKQDELPMPLSFDDSVALCDALGYRLPTEAEWELACRAGHADTTAPWSTPAAVREHAWFNANAGSGPQPVATRTPNALGFHDMLGNVWEWCIDYYEMAPFGTDPAPVDPQTTNVMPGRAMRGASWFTPGNPKPTDRSQDFPATRNIFYGLRPAHDL